MNKKKILIAAGGTGGHVFPAQGLAEQLEKQAHEVFFVAGKLGSNRYFNHARFPYCEVACTPLLSKNPFKICLGVYNLIRGIKQSYQVMRRFRPDAVVGFGSYFAVAPLIAAKLAGIPVVLHEADSIPGKANRWLAPLADAVGVHFPSSQAFFSGKTHEVEMPLRSAFSASTIDRSAAKKYFHLDDSLPVILVFGGSQGARALNQAFLKWIERQQKGPVQFQCIHLIGDKDTLAQCQGIYEKAGVQACVKPFETAMELAWAAADIFIGRSGASTIAEAMHFEVPGLLIPYPYATNKHQDKNAEFFVQSAGGGMALDEKNLSIENLDTSIAALLDGGPSSHYRQAIRQYNNRPSRMTLIDLVLITANKGKSR